MQPTWLCRLKLDVAALQATKVSCCPASTDGVFASCAPKLKNNTLSKAIQTADGTYILPEIGSKVLVAFCMGRMESPYVIGSIWNQTNALPAETANENNTVKTVITKGGNRITVSDEEGKERICVRTKGELAIELDDENQKISAGDKDGNNVWTVDAKEGKMALTAKKEISFTVNGKQMLLLDGNSGKAELKADSIKAEAGQKLQLKGQNTSLEGSSTKISGQSIKAEAQTSLELKGTAALKAESSGMMELKGSMMKLN